MINKITVTGANGFVGGTLCSSLFRQQRNFLATVRKKTVKAEWPFQTVEDIHKNNDWSSILDGTSCVIHIAARVHIMADNAEDPLKNFREVNTFGTINLAEQAAAAGVKRFIFISSIKVNGESTSSRASYSFDDKPLPEDYYGQSKAEAEKGLMDIARQTNMEVVIIRPPLVYGPGVKANFASMMRLASKNLPLPLGAINNKRSLVGIDNLVDLIVTCIDHPKAANQIFLVSDDHDVSTTELLRELTIAAGKKPRLIPVPMKIIRFMATLLGKKSIADRLCGSLQVDINHTKETLGWVPPVSFQEGIARCFKKDY